MLYFPVGKNKPRLLWVESQPAGSEHLHLDGSSVALLVSSYFTFCAAGIAPIESIALAAKMVMSGIRNLEALAKIDKRMEDFNTVRAHYATADGLPRNECI